MNIFESIHYESRLENFCTEILVGILGKAENYELLVRFCAEDRFLKIPEAKDDESLKIESQIPYPRIDDDKEKSFIDIQITGKSFLCFLEMKVGDNILSVEQLKKYDEVLLLTSKEKKLNPHLKFCSRKKGSVSFSTQSSKFTETRWSDIYVLLNEFNEKSTSEIISDFLLFLDSKNMSDRTLIENKSIEISELCLNQSLKLLSKLEIVLNEIRQKIDETNKLGVKPVDEYLDLAKNRFGLHYQYIKIKNSDVFERRNPETSLFIGFDFEGSNINKVIWLWSSNYNLSSYKFDILEQNCKPSEPLKIGKLEDTLNWFLQSDILKQFL